MTSLLNWEIISEKFSEVYLYCQWTLMNYSNILVFIIAVAIIILIIKLLSLKIEWILRKYNLLKNSEAVRKFIKIIIYLMYQFLLINIVSDLINIQRYLVLILISFSLLFVIFGIIIVKFSSLINIFKYPISNQNPQIITFLSFAKI